MRILSGIQPSGRLHLGNYFGMMKPALEMQREAEAYLFIADYHALTTVSDAKRLRADAWDAALDFLACGLDPERTVFYRQSDVPEVTELSWLLSVVTPMGLLQRCHSYKDKVSKGVAPSHGLFSYPVLMAADILSVQSDIVPVGRDQKQHVEVTRDIAQRFNQLYGEVFKLPDPAIRDDVAVVPGVDGQKMSKSYGNTLELFGDLKETRARVMRIVTDSTPLEAPKDPDRCHVFALYRLFADASERESMAARYRAGGFGYGEAKKTLWNAMEALLEPMRCKRAELAAKPELVERILQCGAEKARDAARRTLAAAREAVGLHGLAVSNGPSC